MDTSSIIWAIVIGVIIWFITMVAGEMITRPKLTFEKDWNKRKWVFRLEKNKPAPYAYTGVSGITVTTQGSTSDYGVNEQMKLSGGAFFDFYGITIKNLDDPNVFIHRRVGEITRTILILDDGQQIECRWWSRDYSEKDKLFATDGFSIEDRRKIQISSGSDYHIVLAYRDSESVDFRLFDITNDVGSRFWENKNTVMKLPRYAKLKIFTTAANFEIKLEIHLSNDTKNNLMISEINSFPSLVLLKE